MNVIFMGTTPFSCVILEELLKIDDLKLVAVVTQPDRPFGRKRVLKAPIVKEFALKENLYVLQPKKLNDHADEIRALKPDVIVTCAYGQIVSQEILDIPRIKSINVHASLLPKYRGGAPIHWSIIKGETETGVTLMEMDAGMDSGAMIAKESVKIDHLDTMGDVEQKLMAASRTLLQKSLMPYLQGGIQAVAQNPDEVTYAYTISAKDELIDFNQDVKTVYNHIRGLIPWPVSHAYLDNERVKFHGVLLHEKEIQAKPGTVLAVHEAGTDIACLNGYVTITVIQPAGKPKTAPLDFMNGIGRDWKGKIFNE